MKLIRKVWSHQSIKTGEKYSNKDVRKSDPCEVKSFRSLVELMAQISFNNPDWTLFFRGQTNEYDNMKQLTSMYPTIYRSGGGLLVREKPLRSRFKKLGNAEDHILEAFANRKLAGLDKLRQFRELRWAILRHYEVCGTPLLDITHSLRVACSFALNNATDNAYLYVLGFPHVHGSISYYVEEEMLNIRLLSICPLKAIRPYYQEGYLVATFPTDEGLRSPKLDMGRRLVTKFALVKKRFWDSDFQAIPDRALNPKRDPMKRICDKIKRLIS